MSAPSPPGAGLLGPPAPAGFAVYGADQIRQRVGFPDLVDPVASALERVSRGEGESPIVVFAPRGVDGDVHVKSAWLPDSEVFIVKVAAAFAARRTADRDANSGYLAVHSARTGDLVAMLWDEHHLTDVRTAATGALATRLLSRPDARVAAVLGTGTQAYLQALATCLVRDIDLIHVWGRHRARAARLQHALQRRLPAVTVRLEPSPRAAVREADVVVTATSSRAPILHGEWLRAGQHVTAVGADDATKAELDAGAFERADLVAVESRQAAEAHAGDLAAWARGTDAAGDALSELGEILASGAPGRRHEHDLTVAKLVGIGAEDLATAQVALARLDNDSAPSAEPGTTSSVAAARDLWLDRSDDC